MLDDYNHRADNRLIFYNNDKKYKTFVSKPLQYQCLDDDEVTTDEDKFINEYVFKSKLYCDKNNWPDLFYNFFYMNLQSIYPLYLFVTIFYSM